MANRLERVSICKFRGGTCEVDIDFDASKPVTVIFGENGTGKSTIVDAIAFGIHGDLGSLRLVSVPRGRATYLSSVGTKPADMHVAVTVGGATWKARLNKGEAEVTRPDRAVPPVYVLRRSEVLKLVTSEPKHRYDVLRDLVDVQRIEAAAQELRQALKEAKTAVDFASEGKAVAERILDDLWQESGPAVASSALAWAQTQATVDLPGLRMSLLDAQGLLKASTEAADSWRRLQANVFDASEATRTLQGLRERMERIRATDDGPMLDVLEDAERVLGLVTDTCPVCEQPISVEKLRSRIGERLSELKELSEVKGEIAAAARNAEVRESLLGQHQKLFDAAMVGLLEILKSLRRRFETLPGGPRPVTDAETSAFLARVESERWRVQAAIDADEKMLHRQSVIATNVKAVEEATSSLVELQARAKRLQQISEVVESIRKGYVSEVLTDISERAARMYASIHPQEAIGNVSLFLKQAAVGSLELSGTFAGATNVPPQAYYSESHLDTLGVCVFLAMAERDREAIVIRDDVFTSVDDAHLSRTLELLHDEAANVAHLVITTHYRAWRDRYRYARGPAAHSQLIELLPWAHGHGIRHTKIRLSADELRENLLKEPVDRIGVAARAGVLIEALLDDLTLRYRCRLPRVTDIHYTLGDLFGGIEPKLLKAMRISGARGEVALEPLLQKLLALAFLRNKVGCHFNFDGSNISDTDVREFGDATLAFADAVICDSCGELPRRAKSSEYWQCSCGSTRLSPLRRPGDNAA